MFDWLSSAVDSIGGAIGGLFGGSSGGASANSSGAAASGGSSLGGLLGSIPGNAINAATSAGLGYLSYQGVQDTNATNLELVREANQAALDRQKASQDWEANMANTAEQRQVADLKAAGLNPILAAHGSGAAVPNVASAPVQAGSVQNAMGGAIGTAVSSAQALTQMRLQAEQLKTQQAISDKTYAEGQSASWDAAMKLIDLNNKRYNQEMGGMAQGWDSAKVQNQMLHDQDDLIQKQLATEGLRQDLMNQDKLSNSFAQVKQRNAADANSSWVGKWLVPYLDMFGIGGQVQPRGSAFSASIGR